MVSRDLKFDNSIKENIKLNYQDVKKSAKLEDEIFNFVDLEGKTSPKEYKFVHRASIRPESVNRLSNPKIYSDDKSSRTTMTPRIVKRSQS